MSDDNSTSLGEGYDTVTPTALIISGADQYADPWHAYAETSARIATVLADRGFHVNTREDLEASFATLDDRTDLLVVNAGTSSKESPQDAFDRPAREALLRYLARGGPVLAMHSSASTVPNLPEWEAIVGARWEEGATMHPPLGSGHIVVYPDRHSIVAPSTDFEIWDERYSYMRVANDVIPLASHQYAGLEHPLFWARRYGQSRVVYDALGHDQRSYDSPDHVAMLGRAALWLVGELH